MRSNNLPFSFFQVLIEQYLSIYGESTPAIFNSDEVANTAAAAVSSSGAEDDGGSGVRKISVASTRSNASSGVGKSELRRTVDVHDGMMEVEAPKQ